MSKIKQDSKNLEAITKKIDKGTRSKASRLFHKFITDEITNKIADGIVTLKEFDALINELVDLLADFRSVNTEIEEVNLDEQNLGTSVEAQESQKED